MPLPALMLFFSELELGPSEGAVLMPFVAEAKEPEPVLGLAWSALLRRAALRGGGVGKDFAGTGRSKGRFASAASISLVAALDRGAGRGGAACCGSCGGRTGLGGGTGGAVELRVFLAASTGEEGGGTAVALFADRDGAMRRGGVCA